MLNKIKYYLLTLLITGVCMYPILKGIYDYCFNWDDVDKTADHIIDYFSTPNEKLNPQQRSASKSALLWFTSSTIATANFANSTLSVPVRCTLGCLTLVPFVKPLLSNLKSRIHVCSEELSFTTTIKTTAIFSFFCTAYGMGTYWMSTSMESKKFIPLNIILSNFTMNGAMYVVNQMILGEEKNKEYLSHSDKGNPLQSKDVCCFDESIENAKETVRMLREKIQAIDDFIYKYPELRQICMEEIQAHPDWVRFDVIFNLPPATKSQEPINYIEQLDFITDLKIEANHLESSLRERMEFIEASSRLYDCFKKYFFQASDDAPIKVIKLLKSN